MTEPNFKTFQEVPLEAAVKQAAIEMADDFCSTQCPVKETLSERGMVCSFMVREAFKDETVIPLTGSVLSEVASSNWFHCVDEMRNSGRPIVIIDKGQKSYADIAEYLS